MHLGIHVVQPPAANPTAALRASAEAAEALGYRSLWVGDRLIGPGSIGDGAVGPLDAVSMLAYAAARTDRIRLGTNVLSGAWYPPALLARSLATIDQLSRGRLVIGLGGSASGPEAQMAGVGGTDPGDRVDALLTALDACWGPLPDGPVPGPRPIQQPRPPVLLTGSSEPQLQRAGRRADGWHAGLAPVGELARSWDRVGDAAEAAGRVRRDLAFVVRLELDGRASPGALADGVAELAEIGVTEVILEATPEVGLDAALARYAEVAEAIELRAIA